MAKWIIEDTTLVGIADAIRTQYGTTDSIAVVDMAEAILGIEGGGGNLPFSTATATLTEDSSTITFDHDLGSTPAFGVIFATDATDLIGQVAYKIINIVTDGNNGNCAATSATKAVRNAYASSGSSTSKDESQISVTFGGSTYKFAAYVEYTCVYW